ncbi:MAG: alkaline phosphatase [Verrucomicrobiota bacterium]|jgi:alkaline phosphatase
MQGTHRYFGLMKWRNRLLALFCLVVFAGLGILYFQHWVVQKPFGIILFIGEGLTPGRLAATRAYVAGADSRLAIDSLSHFALLTNYSNDFATPDQAAAATAIATGEKVNNRAIAMDVRGKPLSSIVELAHTQGRLTGLITDTKLTDPTCAAFYSHSTDPDNTDAIALELCSGGKIDIAMGGGGAQFLSEANGGHREDSRDLFLELQRSGFDIVRTKAELEAIPSWRRPKLVGAFTNEELAFVDQIEERSDQPSLSDMVRRAIELLQYNRRGYLLVVDAGLMRKAAQSNNGERTLRETAELDRAVSTAQHYAGARSTIIVCGDVGIGGLHLNGFPFRKDSGIALLGLNSSGEPWLTWASGPKGATSYGAKKIGGTEMDDHDASSPRDGLEVEPAAFYSKLGLGTVEDVVGFGSGPGTEMLQGLLDNTSVFRIVRAGL